VVRVRLTALVLLAGLAASACTNQLSVVLASDAAAPDAITLAPGDVELTSARSPTSSSSTTSTSTTTTTPPDPITLGFVGDVQMIGSMVANEPVAGVTELLSAPDLTLVNLETVIGEANEVGRPPVDKEFIFRSPPETLDQLVDAGVDVVALANNHGWDYGPLGARVTREYVDASPLIGVGGGADPAIAYAPAFVQVNDQTVGVVSLSRVPCDWSRNPRAVRPEIAWGCDRFAIAALGAIAKADAGSDHTVVMLHAGTEVTNCPDDELRRVIGIWIAAGADVVAISHPHVLQGVEIIDGAAVLWSTGNFAFRNRGGRTGRSAVFDVTLSEGAPVITVHPTVLPGGTAEPALLGPAIQVINEVTERSRGGRVGIDGVLIDSTEPSLCD
jgi:poly-gamma-glutamate capsule biosynthesis protein CapA/YwtB (metallophosphatase superfamily)